MQCIFGFGGWNRFYLYLLIAAITKLFKEDIILGENYSFDLIMSKHKIMNLLLDYLSDGIFGILLFTLLKKLEDRRKIQRDILLSSESIEFEANTTIGMVNEMKNKTNCNENNSDTDKKEEKKELNLSSTFNSDSTDSDISQSIHKRYSLIHTNLIENITENSIKYIIISCCLIIPKEMLIKLIYSTNDIFDYYFVNIIIITLILKFYFKANIYRHRLLAVTILTLFSGSCLISCLFIHNYSKKVEERSLKALFSGHYYKMFIVISLYLIFSFLFCIGIIIQKNIMENKFISPYKIIVIKGIIGIIVSIISIIISSLWKCDKMDGTEGFEDYQTFKFFVCSADYKDEKYYDHFIGYFTSFENAKERFKEAMLLILYSIVHFICELCFIFTNKFLSPTHYLISESLYSLLHIPFDYLSLDDYNSVINELNGSDDPTVSDNSDDDNPDFYTVYQAIVHTFGTRILRFFSSIFDFFGYIIYLEIIELRFCGLNRNIKKNIRKRASIDANDDNGDNSSSDSEEGNEQESKKEED